MMNLEYECATTNHPASRWKVIGCTILYNILGYMKSKNIDLVKKNCLFYQYLCIVINISEVYTIY